MKSNPFNPDTLEYCLKLLKESKDPVTMERVMQILGADILGLSKDGKPVELDAAIRNMSVPELNELARRAYAAQIAAASLDADFDLYDYIQTEDGKQEVARLHSLLLAFFFSSWNRLMSLSGSATCHFIRSEFLAYCFSHRAKIRELDVFENDANAGEIIKPGDLFARVIGVVYCAAVKGDREAAELFRQAFRSMERNIYDRIKRLKSLEAQIYLDLVTSDDTDKNNIYILSAIVTLSDILHIPMSESFQSALIAVSRRSDFTDKIHMYGNQVIDFEPYLDQAIDRIGPADQEEESRFFSDFYHYDVAHYLTYSPEELVKCDESNPASVLAKFLALCETGQLDDRKISMKTLAHLCALDLAASTSVASACELKEAVSKSLGFTSSVTGEEETDPSPAGKSVKPGPESLAPGPDDEIRVLRRKLDEERQKSAEFHRTIEIQKQEITRLSEENAQLLSDRKELLALRESVLDQDSDDTEQKVSDEEIRAFLSGKKICLIGGHENWTKKVRTLFPHWRYIRANQFQMRDLAELSKYDLVTLFTDHLDHRTYQRFMAEIREKDLPLGYVTAVNIERGLRQIYAAFHQKKEN